MNGTFISLLVGVSLLVGILTPSPTHAQNQKIGINVVLNRTVNDILLTDLAKHGAILDVIPEINAVTLNAKVSELAAIQALPYVRGANPDRERVVDGGGNLPGPTVPNFAGGANLWHLDAINVTDFGGGRTLAYDGAGIYVAVLDTGLVKNWRAYFPEGRIDTVHACSFTGGGGSKKSVSGNPEHWETNKSQHGTAVSSVILGFHYAGPSPETGAYTTIPFNGVAPRAKIIPIRVVNNHDNTPGKGWSSSVTHGLLYVTKLKASGALGNAPVVVNMSIGGSRDIVEAAAMDYAIAHGVVIVAAAANDGEAGMRYPGSYPPVISVANAGWRGQYPTDDPTLIWWILRDVPENDALQYYIAPDSSRELPGQDLDLAAPGNFIAVPDSPDRKTVNYGFYNGTSFASPHVAGVVALMLQKNPYLAQAQIESILENTALPLAPGSAYINLPVLSDAGTWIIAPFPFSWSTDATGHGLLQADAALAATPLP